MDLSGVDLTDVIATISAAGGLLLGLYAAKLGVRHVLSIFSR